MIIVLEIRHSSLLPLYLFMYNLIIGSDGIGGIISLINENECVENNTKNEDSVLYAIQIKNIPFKFIYFYVFSIWF